MNAESLLPALTAAGLAYAMAPIAARLAVRWNAMDVPGARKVHDHPVPRLGGLAVIGAVLVTVGLDALFWGTLSDVPTDLIHGLAFGIIPILGISILDDLQGVRPSVKLLAHVAGAGLAVACGVSLGTEIHLFGQSLTIGVLAIPLSMAWIIGITNAFNLIDGLDGLSAGLALIAAVSLAAVFALVGQPAMAGAALLLAGALAGFLPHNFYPARQFLGDSGATVIGFSLAALALRRGATLSGGFAVLVPVIIMGLPIADTLVTIVRRGLQRLEHHQGGLLVADCDHIHHRMLALGIDHGRAVLMLYGAGMLCAGTAFASIVLAAHEAAMFTAALLLAGLIGVRRLGYDEFAFVRGARAPGTAGTSVVSRSMFVVFLDVAIVVMAAYAAVRVGTVVEGRTSAGNDPLMLASVLAPLTVLVFWWAGVYRGNWRVTGTGDLLRLCGLTVSASLVGLLGHAVVGIPGLSPSIVIVYVFAHIGLIMVSRVAHWTLVAFPRQQRPITVRESAQARRSHVLDFPTPVDHPAAHDPTEAETIRPRVERDAA